MIENTVPHPLKPLKWYKELDTKKGRIEAGAFLVEGRRAIEQIIQAHPNEILEILATEETAAAYHKYPVRIVTESQFHSISSSKTPQGILAVVRLPADIYSDNLPREVGTKILLLEDIQDPGNVGTLIRTAAAFGFSGIILTKKSADALSPKCVQSAAGSVLSVWIRRTPHYLELARTLQQNGFQIVAADLQGGNSPSLLGSQVKLLLALGNEASGLSPSILEMADSRVKVPIDREKAESLNVAACGAICMYLSSVVR
ncbi:MAG: RNA methyltransferase [Dehalococcoidia bacterium]|nr:RNA methyltransferase [Dehalococcoidia bacterium]